MKWLLQRALCRLLRRSLFQRCYSSTSSWRFLISKSSQARYIETWATRRSCKNRLSFSEFFLFSNSLNQQASMEKIPPFRSKHHFWRSDFEIHSYDHHTHNFRRSQVNLPKTIVPSQSGPFTSRQFTFTLPSIRNASISLCLLASTLVFLWLCLLLFLVVSSTSMKTSRFSISEYCSWAVARARDDPWYFRTRLHIIDWFPSCLELCWCGY